MQSDNSTSSGINKKTTVIYTKNQNQFTKNNKLTCTNVTMLPKNTKIVPTTTAKKSLQNKNNSAIVGRLITHKVPGSFVAAQQQQQQQQSIGNLTNQGSSKMQVTSDTTATTTTTTTQAVNKQPTTSSTIVQASIAQPKIITASTVKAITTVSNVHKIPSKTLASNNVQTTTTTTATTTTPVNSQTITFKDGKLQLGQNSNVIQSVSQLTSANLQNIKSTASKDITTTTNQKQIDAIQMVGGNSSNNNKVQLPASSIITQKQIIIPQKTLTTLQANQQVINKNNIQTTSATGVVQKIPMKNQRIINTSKVIDNQQQPTTKIIVKNSDTSGQQVDKCNSNNTDLLNIKKDNKNTVLISTNQQGTPQVTFQQLNNPQLVQIHGNKTLTALSVNQKVQGNIKNPLQQQQQPFVLKINTSKNTNDNIQINVKPVAQKPTTTTTTSLTKIQQAEVIQQLQGVYNQNIQIVDVANQPPVVNSSPSKKRTKQIIRKDTGKVNSVTKRTTDGNIVDTVNDDNDDNDNDDDDKKLINNSVTKQQVWITKNNNQTVESLQSNDSIVKQQKQQQVIRKTLGDISSSDDCSSNKNLLDPSNVPSVVVNANKKTTDTIEHSSLSSQQQQQDTTVYSGQQRSTPIKTHSNMSSFDTLISAAFNESAQSLDQIDYQSNDSQCKDYKKQNINKLTQDNNKFSYPGKKPTRIKTSLNTDMNCLKLSIDNSTDKLKSNDQLSNNIIPRERYQIQPSGQKITFLSSLPQQDNTLRISKKITGIKTSLNTDMNPLKTLAVAASVASNEHMIKTNVKNLIQQNKNPSNILQKNQNIKIQSQNNSPQQSQFLNTQQSSQLQNKNKPFVHVTLSPETRRNIERKLNIIPDKKDIIFNENNDVKREINFADTNRKALLPHECLQFVLQDHNYGAPRPKTPISTSPVKQQQQHHHQQQQQPINGATSSTFSHQTFNYNPGVVKSNGAKIEDDAASAISSDAGRDVEPEGEETDTAPEGEGDGDDEDSVTRCICGFEHDDGYMISCDRCLTWQHVDCMGIDRSNIPEKYLCEQCEPRRIDHQRARTLQLRKREELMNSDSTSDTASTSSADTDHGTNITPVNSTNVKKRSGPQQQNVSRRKSDPVQHRRLNNNNNNNSNNNLNNINENNSVVVNNNYSNTLNKNSRQNNNNTTTRKRDMTTISATSPAAPIAAAASSSLPASTVSATTTTPKRSGGSSNSGAQGKRRNKRRSSVNCDEDNQDSWGSSMTPLRKWIEQYEDAVTNHYSPELRARVSSIKINSGYNNEFKTIINNNNTNTMTNNKCRVSEHNNSSNILVFKYLLATIYLPPNTLVLELRGKYMLSTQYKPPHQGRQIAQRPGPFVFFYRLPRDGPEICVDTRTYGNDARFIRRSCTPNAEIKHCLEKGTIHLYIVTTQTIDKNEEITIRHEQHDMILSNNTNANSLLQFACACGNPRTCKVASSNQVGNNSRQVNNTISTITATTTTSSTAASATTTTTNGNSIENPTDGRERRRRGRRSTVSEDNNDSISAGPSNISNIQSNNQTVTQKLSTENAVESSAVTIAKKLRDELRRKTKDNSKIESQITTEQSEVSSVKNSTSEKSVIIPFEEPSSKITPIPPTTTTTMTTIITTTTTTTTTTTVSRQPSPITTLATAAAVVAEIETAMTTTAAVSPIISPTVSSKLSSESTAPTVKSTQAKNKNETQKLNREDRKIQAIMKSFEQMEKAAQRKKEVKARNKQRKESGGNSDNDKIIYGQNQIGSSMKNYQNKKQHNNIERPIRRKRRKGRSRTTSTSSQKQSNSRLSRLSSADSDLSSNDDNNISIQSSFVRRRQQSQLQTNVLPLSSLSSSSSTTPSAAAATASTTSSSSYNDNIYSSSNINNCNDNNNSSSIPTAAGLLLALASGGNVNNNNNINDNLSACQLPPPPPPLCKSPTCDSGASSSSSQSSTPSTPLSSACLLVAAAVGPLAPGFKFPKTKKVLMNEWLRKSPEPQQQQQQQQINSHNTIVTASMLSPNNFNYNIDNNKTNDYINQQQNYAAKSLATLVQAANSVSGICDSSSSSSPQRKQTNAPLLNTIQGQLSSGSAKKRWLRQAISEECESPNSRPESPPCEIVAAPPKKRRIARESMSSDNYTPPTTPTHLIPDNNYIINNNIHNNNNNNNNNDQTIYSTIDNDYSDRLPVQQSTSSTTVSYVTTSYPDHETEDKDLEMKKLEFYRNFDLINCNNVNNVVRKIEPIVEVKNETKDLIAKIEIDNDDYNNNDDGEDDKKIIEINIKNDDVIAVEPIKMETIMEMDSIKKEEITMEDSSVSSNIKIEKTEQHDDQILSNEIDEYNCSTPTITSSEINNSNDEKNNTNDLLSITNNDQMSIDEFDVEAQMKKITGDDSNDFICTKEKIDISLEKSKESFDGIEGLMESPKEDSGSDDKDEDEEEKYNNNIEEDDDEEEEEEKEIEKINNINEEKNNDIEDENLLKLTNKNDEKKEEEERAFKEIEKMSFTLNNDDDDNTTTTPTTTDFINENNKTEQLNVNVTTTGAATTSTACSISEESMFDSISNLDCESVTDPPPEIFQSIPPLSERIRKKKTTNTPKKKLDFEASIIESTLDIDSSEITENGELNNTELSAALRQLLESKIDEETPPPPPTTNMIVDETEILSVNKPPPDDDYNATINEIQQQISSTSSNVQSSLPPPPPSSIQSTPSTPLTSLQSTNNEIKRLKDPRRAVPHERPACETPAPIKRKLSITEYRKRKQQSSNTTSEAEPSNENSPEKSPNRGRSDSASSGTSSLSSDDENTIKTISSSTTTTAATTSLTNVNNISDVILNLPLFSTTENEDKKGGEDGKIGWSSAPTLVERQRENLTERLKREFGLFLSDDEEERARKQGLTAEAILKARLSGTTADLSLLKNHTINFTSTQLPPQVYIPPPGTATLNYSHLNDEENYQNFTILTQQQLSSASSTQVQMNDCHSTELQSTEFLVPEAPPGSNPYPPQFSTTITSTPLDPPPFDNNLGTIQSQSSYYNHP